MNMVRPHILLVEDEYIPAMEVEAFLIEHGYRVSRAGNGVEAIMSMSHRDIDILVTDLNMPVMDGNELIDRVRETDPHLPIFVISAYVTGDQVYGVAPKGGVEYVQKPLMLADLLERLDRLTSKA